MTVGAAIALAAFHLENDDFLGTEEIFDHAGDLGTFDNGGTDIELAVISGDSGLATFTVEGITEPHPFHVVFTRGTNAGKYSEQFLSGQ